MFSLLPVGESLGAFILVGLGMWLICDSDDGAKEVINHPEKIDIDNSRIIEPCGGHYNRFCFKCR